MSIRLIDAGTVSHLRSQSLYHGLAYARSDATPDTIVLATPRDPYVCIGFHQDLEREVDLDFCAQRGLPVLRRETGGGAVYLDRQQLFVQWIADPARLPARVEQRFELFAAPLVATYRALGIAASFRPVNDVHVGGRKIVGTGAAHIGNAEVLVGNFILDFDTDVMARIPRAPSDAFRAQLGRSLDAYMTSIRRELGRVPERSEIAAIYIEEAKRALGAPLEPGAPTPDELAAIEEADRRLASEAFLRRPGGLRRRGVKIHEDVSVVESTARRNGDVLRVTARLHAGRIEDVVLSVEPDHTGELAPLARALHGIELRRAPVAAAANEHDPGRAAAWVDAILDLDDARGDES